jgi:hypothetical protein
LGREGTDGDGGASHEDAREFAGILSPPLLSCVLSTIWQRHCQRIKIVQDGSSSAASKTRRKGLSSTLEFSQAHRSISSSLSPAPISNAAELRSVVSIELLQRTLAGPTVPACTPACLSTPPFDSPPHTFRCIRRHGTHPVAGAAVRRRHHPSGSGGSRVGAARLDRRRTRGTTLVQTRIGIQVLCSYTVHARYILEHFCSQQQRDSCIGERRHAACSRKRAP